MIGTPWFRRAQDKGGIRQVQRRSGRRLREIIRNGGVVAGPDRSRRLSSQAGGRRGGSRAAAIALRARLR